MVKMAHGENDFKKDRTYGINPKKEEYFRLYFCRKRSLINIILVKKKNYFVQRFLKYEDATWIIVETTVTSERAPNSMLEFSHGQITVSTFTPYICIHQQDNSFI